MLARASVVNPRARPSPPRSGDEPMPAPRLIAIDRPEVPPRTLTPRLRSQLVYFMTPRGSPGLPILDDADYWLAAEDVDKWLDDGVFYLLSPLDTANMTEVELTEEQETLLRWFQENRVQHVRIDD